MTCTRAQEFLAKHKLDVAEQTEAAKEKRGARDALALARSVDRIIVARGKKVQTFDMKKDPPDDETLLKQLLGPTGNLRAPTMRKGKILLVGFQEEEFGKILT